MPIYEFKCLRCGHVFELMQFKKSDQTEMKCPECGGENIERIISKIGMVSAKSGSIRSTFRSCGEGTCGSIEIPGPEK